MFKDHNCNSERGGINKNNLFVLASERTLNTAVI